MFIGWINYKWAIFNSSVSLPEGNHRSLQREAQHIGHFVGIDKDDWMCHWDFILREGGWMFRKKRCWEVWFWWRLKLEGYFFQRRIFLQELLEWVGGARKAKSGCGFWDPKAPKTTSSFLNGKVWRSQTDGTERCSVVCIYMWYIYIYMYIWCIYIYIWCIYLYIYAIYIWTYSIYGSFTQFLVYHGELLILLQLIFHKMLLLWCKT